MQERSGPIVIGHPGEIDVSRQLAGLSQRLTLLEGRYAELLDLVHRMTQVNAAEHTKKVQAQHALENRVREMELAS